MKVSKGMVPTHATLHTLGSLSASGIANEKGARKMPAQNIPLIAMKERVWRE